MGPISDFEGIRYLYSLGRFQVLKALFVHGLLADFQDLKALGVMVFWPISGFKGIRYFYGLLVDFQDLKALGIHGLLADFRS